MQAEDDYPLGSVRRLLASELVTSATRTVLEQRLQPQPTTLRFFSPEEANTLRQVAVYLFPRAADYNIDLIAPLDQRLAAGDGDGWRYDALPPDAEAQRLGVVGLNETARASYGLGFAALTPAQQVVVLHEVAAGQPAGATWQTLPAARYFEDLLAELTEYYYSHPLVQEEIGYVGLADAAGWQRIGLNQLEAWEPRPSSEYQVASTEYELPADLPPALKLAATSTPPSRPSPQSTIYPAGGLPSDRNLQSTIVVIGTGAGGAPLAARLAQAGLPVVILEAGQHWQPQRDFATDERAQNKLYWNDERLSAGNNPTSFGRNNSGIGVGGSTLHYTAYTPRAQLDDLRLHRDFGVGVDWPLDYADIEPYYDELEAFLGISGPTPYPWGPPRKAGYPLAPLPLNGAAQLMQRGCAALGIRTSPAANAALSAPYHQPGLGWRPACTNRGFCQAGCSVGAKASMDVTFIPLALQYGAELRTECFVTGFERDAAARISGVVYTQDGIELRQLCQTVFLCAGGIESPRLLLLGGLANSSGQVGLNFMAHVGLQVWGQFEDDVRPYKGIPAGLISEDTHRPKDANFAGGYLTQSIGVMPLTYAGQLVRERKLWGADLQQHMVAYNHTAGINILGECLPQVSNYLELSGELDGRGLPKPRIHFSYGDNELKLQAHAEHLMRSVWQAAGGRDLWSFHRSAHVIGTCRMGSDPTSAVVDRDCRSFDVPNLYIVDNSVFPSALSVNPALTIMAISLRTADRFIERLRHREALWLIQVFSS